MAFSWAETITQNTTKIKASHISELKTNIQTERTARDLGTFSWSRTPAAGDLIEQDASTGSGAHDFLDLRYVLDEIYDNNHCFTHYSTHYTSYCGGNYAYYSGHLGTYIPCK